MRKRLLIAVVAVASVAMLRAQTPAAPAFDVTSIKPNHSSETDYGSYVQPGGRYLAVNITLRMLMRIAYGVHESQIIGGPSWMDTDRFDVTGKAEGYPDAGKFRDVARLMLRPLLTDRFKLVLRRDARELPVYAMVVAKPGEFGPKLHRNDDTDCTIVAAPVPADPAAPLPPASVPCGAEMFTNGYLRARAVAIPNLAISLTRFADRVVVNETGLTGKFDWDLFWLPDSLALSVAQPIEGPSMFSAFRDQAGLKLEPRRSVVDVLVVESAAHPESD